MRNYIEINAKNAQSLKCAMQFIHMQLHSLQTSIGTQQIGISFPLYQQNRIGNRIRLFCRDESLLTTFCREFNELDGVTISDVTVVPRDAGYGRFTRIQVKSSNKRLARRKSKRDNIDLQAAIDYFSNRTESRCALPNLLLESKSTAQKFPMFIGFQLCEKSKNDEFTSYGLSKNGSTVPIF
jgi:CRISPR-associated endonuclease Csy4